MDRYVERLTQELKTYSKDLYAERASNGTVQVYRKTVRWESFEFQGKSLAVSRLRPELVFPLTDTWTVRGKPVEWGIEPVSWKIREMDAQRDDSYLERMEKENERVDQIRKQSHLNEVKATAADMRKDFAKAVNDINTSALDMTDPRRKQDGNSK